MPEYTDGIATTGVGVGGIAVGTGVGGTGVGVGGTGVGMPVGSITGAVLAVTGSVEVEVVSSPPQEITPIKANPNIPDTSTLLIFTNFPFICFWNAGFLKSTIP